MTYIVSGKDVVVCVIPKCGSQSMIAALTQARHKIVTKEAALEYDTRVAFVCDPIKRLDSLFSHFCHLAEASTRFNEFMPRDILIGKDRYERFIDYILKNDNDHWDTQVSVIDGVANTLHPFEVVNEEWLKYADRSLPRLNSWSTVHHSVYRETDILRKYKPDLELRERI